MHLVFVFAVLLVNSLQRGKAYQECVQQAEKSHSHTNPHVASSQVYIHGLLVQHLCSVFFQNMVWYGPTSQTAWMQRNQKNWSKHTDFTELKKTTSRIYSNCSNYSSLFSRPSNFFAVRFVSSKKFAVNGTRVLFILLHSTFVKGKFNSGISVGFSVFFLSGLLKTWFFCLDPIASTLKIIMNV